MSSWRILCVLALVAIWPVAATAQEPPAGVGVRVLAVPADDAGPALHALLFTPCASFPDTASAETRLGPFVLPAVRDCPVAGAHLPLVVLSHGHGGSALSHRDTALVLAGAGFAVASLDHPGDSATDSSRGGELSVLVERPADLKRLIDAVLAGFPEAVDPGRIGVFGFSRGGYAALVVAGGEPDFRTDLPPCPDPRAPMCAALRRGKVPAGPFAHDPRVRAIAIADPLNLFAPRAALTGVHVPVQLWISEYGGEGVEPAAEERLAAALPQPPEIHRVAGAGHFAFLAPCPAELAARLPELCRDGAGFDRVAFHRTLNAAVMSFFRRHLGD